MMENIARDPVTISEIVLRRIDGSKAFFARPS